MTPPLSLSHTRTHAIQGKYTELTLRCVWDANLEWFSVNSYRTFFFNINCLTWCTDVYVCLKVCWERPTFNDFFRLVLYVFFNIILLFRCSINSIFTLLEKEKKKWQKRMDPLVEISIYHVSLSLNLFLSIIEAVLHVHTCKMKKNAFCFRLPLQLPD